MKAEKQHKELQSGLVQSKRERSKLSFVDNRSQAASQTNLIQSIQKKENKTEFPDNLKTDVENLSGISIDDIRKPYDANNFSQFKTFASTKQTMQLMSHQYLRQSNTIQKGGIYQFSLWDWVKQIGKSLFFTIVGGVFRVPKRILNLVKHLTVDIITTIYFACKKICGNQ